MREKEIQLWVKQDVKMEKRRDETEEENGRKKGGGGGNVIESGEVGETQECCGRAASGSQQLREQWEICGLKETRNKLEGRGEDHVSEETERDRKDLDGQRQRSEREGCKQDWQKEGRRGEERR